MALMGFWKDKTWVSLRWDLKRILSRKDLAPCNHLQAVVTRAETTLADGYNRVKQIQSQGIDRAQKYKNVKVEQSSHFCQRFPFRINLLVAQRKKRNGK